jgi:hypothetical protein
MTETKKYILFADYVEKITCGIYSSKEEAIKEAEKRHLYTTGTSFYIQEVIEVKND